jgi:hypothetical protein
MNDERDKRLPRSYKAKGSVYCAAFAAAHTKGTTLAKEVEKFVIRYAKGKKKK